MTRQDILRELRGLQEGFYQVMSFAFAVISMVSVIRGKYDMAAGAAFMTMYGSMSQMICILCDVRDRFGFSASIPLSEIRERMAGSLHGHDDMPDEDACPPPLPRGMDANLARELAELDGLE